MALPTVFSFLSEKGISIEESPNTRVEDDVVDLLVKKFKPDQDFKFKSSTPAAPARQTPAPTPAEAKPEVPNTDPSVKHPRILGRLELDAKGNPVIKTPAPEPKPAPKAEEKPAPKAVEKPAEKPAASEKKPEAAPKVEEKPAPKPAPKEEVKAEETEEKPTYDDDLEILDLDLEDL